MTSPLEQARYSLQQTLTWYSSFARHGRHAPSPELQTEVRPQLQNLKGALDKLEHPIFRIAMFGLVSRGKSAVVNALLGQKRLMTSPINGETRYPQAVQWTLNDHLVELIDTPGLDEIEGQIRADMAKEVAAQADLILFVVAGDITQTEYLTMQELRATHKPLILVFNKMDLYPDVEREMIWEQLAVRNSQFAVRSYSPDPNNPLNKGGREDQAVNDSQLPVRSSQFAVKTQTPPTQEVRGDLVEDVIMVAAEPVPILVRHEWPDGSVTEEWETPEPAIAPLRKKLAAILDQSGDSLIALNALVQGQAATQTLAQVTIDHQQAAAEALIWKYAQGKAIAVAANPIAVLDIVGGMLTDLALIRALAKLYGLPMTSFAAEKLWRKIVFSSAMLTFGELGGGIVLGIGKTSSLALEGGYPWGTWSMAALLQGGLAGYGSYVIGKVAQGYLVQGCTWGDRGISPTLNRILAEVDAPQIMARLRQELTQI